MREPLRKALIFLTSRGRREQEFKSLIVEAGYSPVAELRLRRIKGSKVLSEAKAELARKYIEEYSANFAIFDRELKPVQAYNVAKELKVEVLDIVQLILQVFVKHASSAEAKLQIRLASLMYELARAKEKVRLARLGEQPGFRGLGSYEVDVYYDHVKRQITIVKRKLERVAKRRRLHRAMRIRRGFRTVSLAGYTCSGKTTLFNALTKLNQRTGPEPFTTLSTKFALLNLGSKKVYLVDTIGFIEHLPPTLVQAFNSTLEETAQADAIILVTDVSEPLSVYKTKLNMCIKSLAQAGAVGVPLIIALNKSDIADPANVEEIAHYVSDCGFDYCVISALKGVGLQSLLEKLKAALAAGEVRINLQSRQYS